MSQLTIQPVRVGIVVELSPDRAFRLFTDGIGTWWPHEGHSMAEETYGVRAETVVLEGRVGGRIFERIPGRPDAVWGNVLVWDPPHRVTFSWKPNLDPLPPTEVEVRFTAEGARTRVEIEHRGWDRLGGDGERKRRAYDSGWPRVLDQYAKAADKA
jgi:uncharacterized protein YndB with AHSA1/START domain